MPQPVVPAAPSFFSYWKELASVLALFGVSLGTVLWMLGNLVFERQFLAAFRSRRTDVKDILDQTYEDRIKQNASTALSVEAMRGEVERQARAILDQGIALQRRQDEQHSQNVKTLAVISETLVALQAEMKAVGGAMIEVRTYLTTRDGDGPFGTRAGDIPAPRARKRRDP